MNRRPTCIRLVLLWVGFIALDTAAQITMKIAADKLYPPPLSGQWMRSVVESPLVWSALACLLAAFGIWLRILEASRLGVAFAATSLTLIGVLVASWLFLGEGLSVLGYAGIAAIILGVALVRPLSHGESSSSNLE